MLHLFSETLRKVDEVSQLLQKKQVNLGKQRSSFLSWRIAFNMRNSNLFEQYAEKACGLCQECKISSTAIQKRSKRNRKLEDFIVMGLTGEPSSDTYHVYSSISSIQSLTVWLKKLDSRFCNDSWTILSVISALCSVGQTFRSEERLKEFANAYSISEKYLKHGKHELPQANDLLRKESQLPTFSFIYSSPTKLRWIVYTSCY